MRQGGSILLSRLDLTRRKLAAASVQSAAAIASLHRQGARQLPPFTRWTRPQKLAWRRPYGGSNRRPHRSAQPFAESTAAARPGTRGSTPIARCLSRRPSWVGSIVGADVEQDDLPPCHPYQHGQPIRASEGHRLHASQIAGEWMKLELWLAGISAEIVQGIPQSEAQIGMLSARLVHACQRASMERGESILCQFPYLLHIPSLCSLFPQSPRSNP